MLYDCLACSASEWRFAKNRSPLQDRDSQPRGCRSTRAAKRTPETLWLKCQTGLTSEDLAQKTRRGLEGRIRQGKSGGGLCFGYAVVRKLDAAGEVVRGERRINEAEAATVRRTFEEFAIGRSPRAIAQSLNKDGIPGPAAKSWGPSTIYGNWQRGTGNPQQRALCRPTGLEPAVRQRSKYRAASGETQPGTKWIIELVPHLGIIDDPLWSRVKERQRDSRSRVMTKDTGIAPSGRAGRAIFSPVCSSVAPAVAGSQKLVVSTTVVPLPETREPATTCSQCGEASWKRRSWTALCQQPKSTCSRSQLLLARIRAPLVIRRRSTRWYCF